MTDLPKFHQFMTPLLEVLRDQGEMRRNDAIDTVIRREGITPAQLSLTEESTGRPLVRGRIGWAASYMRQAGVIEYPRRGFWRLGGHAASLLALGRPATVADLEELPEWQAHQAQKQAAASRLGPDEGNAVLSDSTPEDLIERGIRELRAQVVTELLDNIRELSPAQFEQLVLRVLAAMGYGGGDLRSMSGVPRGPDGGIDGKINEDKLGLDQIYIQAKRYSDSSVGRPAVQAFLGAMTGGGCRKGVFVTSSCFTEEARTFTSVLRDHRLVLIDGPTFASLMIDHGVGVQMKAYHAAKVDRDFFAEGE